MTQTTKNHWLRLAPDDVPLVWGILDGYKEVLTTRWPRLDRVLFDLEVMMREAESNAH